MLHEIGRQVSLDGRVLSASVKNLIFFKKIDFSNLAGNDGVVAAV